MSTDTDNWTLNASDVTGPIGTYYLEHDERTLEARVRVERSTVEPGLLHVKVDFVGAIEPERRGAELAASAYARAEAARLHAAILDTVGDFAMSGDEPLALDSFGCEGAVVTLRGHDALIAIVGFFGEAIEPAM